jgi:hypothetical protein
MRASSAGALLLLVACESTGPSTRFLGYFASPLRDRTSYLAFQIFDTDGRLSGRGWSSYSTTLLAGVTLSGTLTDSSVALAIRPRPPLGLVDWRFEGSLAGDTLKGVFSLPGTDAQRVEMPRVSTIPLGDYVIVATGPGVDSTRGFSTFSYGGGSFRMVQVLSVPDRSVMVISWNRRDLPAPGRYAVSPEGGEAPAVRFVYAPAPGAPEVVYQVQSGVITIQQSDRYVLVGRYLMTVAHPDGHLLKLAGVFNSGCTGNAC